MKKIINIISAFVIPVFLFGQENTKKLQFTPIDKKYTWRTSSITQIDSFYYKLMPIETSLKKMHIRISLVGQIIDLFSMDGEEFNGILTNTSTEYGYKKVKNEDFKQRFAKKEVYEKIPLEGSNVKFVVNSLFFSGQFEIPTDSLIPDWNGGFFHCRSIYFQHKINGQYKFQTYFCPWGQDDSVNFKSIIIKNYDLLQNTFKLDSLYGIFERKLPKGKIYSKDGYWMILQMTDKQSKNWAKSKPKRDYLKSVKDTIDSYLNYHIKKQKINLDELDCYEDYRLTFGMNGKLKKIRISKFDRPKLRNSLGLGDFFADKKEIQKCKLVIRELFKEIDLSFINKQYEIYRIFSMSRKEGIELRDGTSK